MLRLRQTNGVGMRSAAAEHTTRRKYKESLAIIFIHHQCLHPTPDRWQSRCSWWSSRGWLHCVGTIGHQPMPPTKVLIENAARVTRLVAVLIICVCVLWNGGGCTRARDKSTFTTWTHNVSSIMECCNRGTKLCGMLITYPRLGGSGPLVVSTWGVAFSSCHKNHELEASPISYGLELVRSTPIRDVPKRGGIVPKMETSQT